MTMMLSDAIRVGSKMHGPSESGWNDIGPDGEVRTCPLTAASEAYGQIVFNGTKIERGPKWIPPTPHRPEDRGGKPSETFTNYPDEWVAILMWPEQPPCACEVLGTSADVHLLVQHLYDVHRWSREQIADWVEQAELHLDERQWIAAKGPNKPWVAGTKW